MFRIVDTKHERKFKRVDMEVMPKSKYHRLVVTKTPVSISVSVYNDGAYAFIEHLNQLELVPGAYTRKFVVGKDNSCLINSRRKASEASLEARRPKRRARKEKDEQDDGTTG